MVPSLTMALSTPPSYTHASAGCVLSALAPLGGHGRCHVSRRTRVGRHRGRGTGGGSSHLLLLRCVGACCLFRGAIRYSATRCAVCSLDQLLSCENHTAQRRPPTTGIHTPHTLPLAPSHTHASSSPLLLGSADIKVSPGRAYDPPVSGVSAAVQADLDSHQ